MFGYWKERNVLPSSPITAIKAVKVKGGHVQGPYTDEQVAAILAAVPQNGTDEYPAGGTQAL